MTGGTDRDQTELERRPTYLEIRSRAIWDTSPPISWKNAAPFLWLLLGTDTPSGEGFKESIGDQTDTATIIFLRVRRPWNGPSHLPITVPMSRV